jgi:hypothetical protein
MARGDASGCQCFLQWSLYQAQEACQETTTQELPGGVLSRGSSTSREIENYSKEDPMNVVHLHNKPCYNLVKERGTDERFWTFFHQDWYQTVLYPKSSPVIKQQYVDIEYMRNKKDMHFNKILEACGLHGITNLL